MLPDLNSQTRNLQHSGTEYNNFSFVHLNSGMFQLAGMLENLKFALFLMDFGL